MGIPGSRPCCDNVCGAACGQIRQIAVAINPFAQWQDKSCIEKIFAVYRVFTPASCHQYPIHWQTLSFISMSLTCCSTLQLLQSPGLVILRLAIPVVDEDRPKNNWCRPLVSLQCIISPVLAIFLASTSGMHWANPELSINTENDTLSMLVLFSSAACSQIGGVFPVWALVLMLGAVLCVVVFLTSTNEEPPKYHWVMIIKHIFLLVSEWGNH